MRGFPKFINSFLVTTGKWDAIDFKTFNLLTRVVHAGLFVILVCIVGSMIILSPIILWSKIFATVMILFCLYVNRFELKSLTILSY